MSAPCQASNHGVLRGLSFPCNQVTGQHAEGSTDQSILERTSDCLDVGDADGPLGLEGDLRSREAGLEHGHMALCQQHDSPV